MPGSAPAFARPVTLRRTLACDLAAVRPAVQTIHQFLAEQGWGEGDLMSFDLALAEACNNAIEHAEGPGRDRPVVVEAVSDASQVEFRIHDHTPGFDWPEKLQLPSPESESGRGLWLIASLMNYAGYFRGRGENLLVLRKSRPSVTAPIKPLPRPEPERAPEASDKDALISDMVEELSSCYESLSAIFRYGAELGKPGGQQEFARRLLGDLLRILQAEWFVLRLVPREKLELAVFAASEPALELGPLGPGVRAEGKRPPLEIEAALTRQTMWFDAEKPPPPEDPLAKAKPGSAGMAHPILLGGRLIGTLAIGRKPAPGAAGAKSGAAFTAAQTNVVNTFADFLAIQIANARFQEEHLHQRLVAHELEIARNIQRSLLPASLPQITGLSLAAFCRNAREVGGDFYDALRVDEDALLLVIADVMGKGVPAAMFAAILRTLLRASPELTRQPSALLARVNKLMCRELSDVDMFITAQLALVDGAARKITTASAGHCPLALAGLEMVRSISPEGMPLGIKPDTVFEEETVDLPKNCRVLLYSDGLTETLNCDGKPFGQARLFDWLHRSAASWHPAEKLKDELIAELDRHHAGVALRDDQTFLILCG
jgi:serine phosphatase RsbU (regulator of sigma subunit)/anti-sigma regulatory factor (Ser/Thr protein kinase)